MEIQVTFSANAGVCVQSGGYRIWVDALHKEKQPGCSAVSPELFQQVLSSENFSAPNWICVTHCHPDHYSPEMVDGALAKWPSAQLCLPGCKDVRLEDVSLQFIPLPHEGAQYADVLHFGVLIRVGDKTILIPGDCETASPAMAQVIWEQEIDLAILNFPWVTLAKGRTFLTQVLQPTHILLCHLPFAEDDVGGFRASAKRSAQLLPQMDVRLLDQPLQTEIINI